MRRRDAGKRRGADFDAATFLQRAAVAAVCRAARAARFRIKREMQMPRCQRRLPRRCCAFRYFDSEAAAVSGFAAITPIERVERCAARALRVCFDARQMSFARQLRLCFRFVTFLRCRDAASAPVSGRPSLLVS